MVLDPKAKDPLNAGYEEEPQTILSLTIHLVFSMAEALTSPLKCFKGLFGFFPGNTKFKAKTIWHLKKFHVQLLIWDTLLCSKPDGLACLNSKLIWNESIPGIYLHLEPECQQAPAHGGFHHPGHGYSRAGVTSCRSCTR